MSIRIRCVLASALPLSVALVAACDAPSGGPGLHTMMYDLGIRHASLWFAGDAGNWELADYMLYELEEAVERIEEVHPTYDDIPVATMLQELTRPRIEDIEAALDAERPAAFAPAFDALTRACNQCHAAAGRAAIVIQRPTAPPLTNLRYAPPSLESLPADASAS